MTWTRNYQYDTVTNRLNGTSAPGDGAGIFSDTYSYSGNGATTRMTSLPVMDWDYADRLHHANMGPGGGDVFFTYDGSGQRVRKVFKPSTGTTTLTERIYIGGWETFRSRDGGTITSPVTKEIQTLHVMDDKRRIAMVERTTTGGTPATAGPLWRFQLTNLIDSAVMELDAQGRVISYEEYHPYGTTAFRSSDASSEVSPKRYRFTGKERDEETGLYYHGARYYAPWLGRWTAADPAGFVDGLNLYRYGRDNPVRLTDPRGTQSQEQEKATSSAPRIDVGPAARRAAAGRPPGPRELSDVEMGIESGPLLGFNGWFQPDDRGTPLAGGKHESEMYAPLPARPQTELEGDPLAQMIVVGVVLGPVGRTLTNVLKPFIGRAALPLVSAGEGAAASKSLGGSAKTGAYFGLALGILGAVGEAVTEAQVNKAFGKAEEPAYEKDFEKTPEGKYVVNPTSQRASAGPITLIPGKEYIYSVEENLDVVVGEEYPVGTSAEGFPQKLGHPTLTGGAPARISGELRYMGDGKWSISNKSGRYSAYLDRTPEQLNNAAALLQKAGVNIGEVKYVNLVPRSGP